MGAGGHSASSNGLDYALVRAGAGQAARLEVRALWLSQGNNVHITVDGGEETVLRGTELPAVEDAGRRFRSKKGGEIQVTLVTDKLMSLSFFSMVVSAVCVADGSVADAVCYSIDVGYIFLIPLFF